jgi:hypothetical protein
MILVGTDSCLGIRVIAEEFNVNKDVVRKKCSFNTPNVCVMNEYCGQNERNKMCPKIARQILTTNLNMEICVRKSC